MQITTLFVLQVINIAIAVIFLVLFLYRLHYLRHFSQTDKYLNYYPKTRILFVVLYVVLSLSLLGYNIATKEYSGDTFEYLFAGGGGETINSLVLILLLIVLRQELKKERPYTPTHMIYFFYLVVISIVRFAISLSNLISGKQNTQLVNLILASCLMADSCVQLGYWIAKKQSLPEFEANNYFSFEDFRKIQSHRTDMINRDELPTRMEQKSMQDDFPYIKPTVNVENSRFRVILEVLASNNILPPGLDSTQIQKMFLHPSEIQNKNISQVLKSSISLRKSMIISQTKSTKGSFHLQIISEHLYNLEQVKQLYLLCGRFPLKKQIVFGNSSLRQIGLQLQLFLQEVLAYKEHYQPFLLKFFHIDKEFIKIYEEKTQGLQDFVPCETEIHSSPKYPNSHQIQGDLIQRSIRRNNTNYEQKYHPPPIVEKKYSSQFDHNAIYISVQIYKQLWIEDHYEFYMKVYVKENSMIVYPMRRFSEFEELDSQLREVLNEHAQTKDYMLPSLPKKHLFYLDDEKINMRRVELERYLRKICNDYTLVEIPQVREVLLRFLNLYTKVLQLSPIYEQDFYRQVEVVKGNISKALINNDYVTFYEFKLFRQGIEIRSITKRFMDFVMLDQDITRWMNNIKICYKTVQLPEKHLYKSETHRHEKLRAYLQSIISIKESYKIYSLNLFFNISGNNELSDDTIFSAISFIRSKRKDSSFDLHPYTNKNNSPKESVNNNPKPFEMQMQKSIPEFSYSFDAKRMSALIEQLGKDDAE